MLHVCHETCDDRYIKIYSKKENKGYEEDYGTASDADAKLLSDKIKELMGKGYTDAKSKMTSAQGKKATAITITYDFDKQTVETEATGTSIKKVSGDL